MSDFIAGTLMAKLITGLGGLVGGVSFMLFYTPVNVWDAAIRSGLAVTAAIVFSPLLLDWLNLQPTMNNSVGSSVAIGFCAWSILSLVARSLINLQDERTTLRMPWSWVLVRRKK
jgi:hypothetical protein